MSDKSIGARIERLVAEEHELRSREQIDSPDADALEADRERLRTVEVGSTAAGICCASAGLVRSSGLTPMTPRRAGGADTVEHYEQ